MVALSIAAVGLGAVSQSLSSSVAVTQQIEYRLLGGWVASNRLAVIRLSREWRVNSEVRNTVTEAGRTWYVVDAYSNTPDPDLVSVEVTVYVDADNDQTAARLFGYIVRPPDARGNSSNNNSAKNG